MTRLKLLDIRAFRGITDLSLAFDGGSIVLGGGNGTGKSACVDALEYLYTGEIATLTGTQGLSLKQHGPHIHARPDEARVTAEFADPDGVASRGLMGATNIPRELENHMLLGARLRFVLRRSQVQQFIHAKPADRYRNMADLIGLEGLDKTETALKRARDTAEQLVHQSQTQAAQIERQITDQPEDPPTDEALLGAANEQLDGLNASHHLNAFEDSARVRQSVLREIGARQPDERLEARAQLATELSRGVGGAHLRTRIDQYLGLISGPSDRNSETGLELLQLLRTGREYIRETHASTCPVCERGIDERLLVARLVRRVADLEELSLRDQQVRSARDDLTAAVQDTSSRIRGLEHLHLRAGIKSPNNAVQDSGVMVVESARSGSPLEVRDMVARLREALDRWDVWSAETAEALHAEVSAAREDPEETSEASTILMILEQLSSLRAAAQRGRAERERLIQERERIVPEMRQRERVLHLADTVHRTFLRVRNEEIQRIFDDLRADLARMYDFLHPGEAHGMVAIAMDLRKRGSSELKIGFHDRPEEDPRAFASEGHLDSLGLCIFLAFVKRFNGDWPLLVLDDVVTSVDAAHKARVARLLFREFGDRQLFITTQDSRWFLELRRAQQELENLNTRNLVIQSWSIDNGPKIWLDESVLG